MTPDQVRREVIADLGRFTHDPLGFVLWAFPWGVPGTSLENEDGPDVCKRKITPTCRCQAAWLMGSFCGERLSVQL